MLMRYSGESASAFSPFSSSLLLYMPKSNMAEVDFVIKKDGKIVPIEVKSGNTASASFNKVLERPKIEVGYKFINGNVGRTGKKITLPHYMVMFL